MGWPIWLMLVTIQLIWSENLQLSHFSRRWRARIAILPQNLFRLAWTSTRLMCHQSLSCRAHKVSNPSQNSLTRLLTSPLGSTIRSKHTTAKWKTHKPWWLAMTASQSTISRRSRTSIRSTTAITRHPISEARAKMYPLKPTFLRRNISTRWNSWDHRRTKTISLLVKVVILKINSETSQDVTVIVQSVTLKLIVTWIPFFQRCITNEL